MDDRSKSAWGPFASCRLTIARLATQKAWPSAHCSPTASVSFGTWATIAALVFCVVAIPAGLFIKHRPLEYRATARIVLVATDEAKAVTREAENGDASSAVFQTQMQVLRSRPLVAKAIANGKLWTAPGFQPAPPIKSGSPLKSLRRASSMPSWVG